MRDRSTPVDGQLFGFSELLPAGPLPSEVSVKCPETTRSVHEQDPD